MRKRLANHVWLLVQFAIGITTLLSCSGWTGTMSLRSLRAAAELLWMRNISETTHNTALLVAMSRGLYATGNHVDMRKMDIQSTCFDICFWYMAYVLFNDYYLIIETVLTMIVVVGRCWVNHALIPIPLANHGTACENNIPWIELGWLCKQLLLRS